MRHDPRPGVAERTESERDGPDARRVRRQNIGNVAKWVQKPLKILGDLGIKTLKVTLCSDGTKMLKVQKTPDPPETQPSHMLCTLTHVLALRERDREDGGGSRRGTVVSLHRIHFF